MWKPIEKETRVAVRGSVAGDSAATASEYVTILAVVIMTIMVSVGILGKKVNSSFGNTGGAITSAVSGNG